MTLYWIFFPLTGLVVGLGAGLFGIGGGFLIVAILSLVFTRAGVPYEVVMHLAIGSSLASIIFTSMSSLWAHHRHGAVLWPVLARLLPGIVMGTLAGSWLADTMNTLGLRVFFGVFALAAAIQSGVVLRPAAHRSLPGPVGMTAAGIATGGVSALSGIGGAAARGEGIALVTALAGRAAPDGAGTTVAVDGATVTVTVTAEVAPLGPVPLRMRVSASAVAQREPGTAGVGG